MAEAWTQYQSVAAEPLSTRVLWVVHQLQQMSRLVSTVHARAERSPAIADWHNNFHFFTGSLLRSELEDTGTPAARLDAEVMIGTFTVEGLLMHPLSEEHQRAICDALAERWPRHRSSDRSAHPTPESGRGLPRA
jgi:hypothetical protein